MRSISSLSLNVRKCLLHTAKKGTRMARLFIAEMCMGRSISNVIECWYVPTCSLSLSLDLIWAAAAPVETSALRLSLHSPHRKFYVFFRSFRIVNVKYSFGNDGGAKKNENDEKKYTPFLSSWLYNLTIHCHHHHHHHHSLFVVVANCPFVNACGLFVSVWALRVRAHRNVNPFKSRR